MENKMKNDLQNKVEKTADELADKTRHAGHVAGEKVQHVENRMQEKGQQWKKIGRAHV